MTNRRSPGSELSEPGNERHISLRKKAEEVEEEVEEQQALHPHRHHFTTNGLNATWGGGGAATEHCNAKEPRIQGE